MPALLAPGRRATPLLLLLVAAASGCGPRAPLTPPQRMAGPTVFGYPISMWDEGTSGETVLLVHVTSDGGVDSVTVDRSSGRMPFDSAATTDAHRLRFVPAHRGGDRVPMWVRLPVRFSRDSAAAAQPDSAAGLPPDSGGTS